MMPVPDFNALRAQTLGQGRDEEAVTVNTRALIDKVLARYSGEWTTLRELLQNAADAGASKIKIQFDTLPSSTVPAPSPQVTDRSGLLKHTVLHHTLRRLLVTNDGAAFNENDWSRLKRIAEGNPDEAKIGAFGVGFYSVFADCEEPFISSGAEAMAFYWKENALFTRRLHLPPEATTKETTFVLDYRNTTSPIPSLLSLCRFLSSSLTFSGLTGIDLYLDQWRILELTKISSPGRPVSIPRGLETKTAEGLMKVATITQDASQLRGKWLNIVSWKPTYGLASNDHPSVKGQPSTQSLRSFFSKFAAKNAAAEKAAADEQALQHALSESLLEERTATVFWKSYGSEIGTSLNSTFHQEITRATKKKPPPMTSISLLVSAISGSAPMSQIDIFQTVLPSTSGRIFIGFPTQQTTGFCAHLSAQGIVPTVERESIDLNARWVRTWNAELLRAAGILSRIAWTSEMNDLKESLADLLRQSKKTSISPIEIESVLPVATHILNQFYFRESTPSDKVGSLMEEAFWTCNKSTAIEMLSTRGVLPSQDVRLSLDELSFVEGIPSLPRALAQLPFVKKLVDYGVIVPLTVPDIKRELGKQALDVEKVSELLRYLITNIRYDKIDLTVARSLLDVTIANNENDGKASVYLLSQIQHFINPSVLPGTAIPLPPHTLPFNFTKVFKQDELAVLGWSALTITAYVTWLVQNAGRTLPPEADITRSEKFAAQILPLISKQWDLLGGENRTIMVTLLRSKTVIPTKLGMKTPEESYFPSVKLFGDLPVISPAVQSTKEKFLLALGVRKTITIRLILERLMASPESESGKSAAWSHVELIKYLASVQADIPPTDLNRLKVVPLCPIAGGDPSSLHKISDLFEPTETLRALGLPTLQWPGVFRIENAEGKLLSTLGLRRYPTVDELVNIAAVSDSLRDPILKYMLENWHLNSYSSKDTLAATKPFLPAQNAGQSSSQHLSLPGKCFTNPDVALLGFSVLSEHLHPHAAKLGVAPDPPIMDAIEWLLHNPPQGNTSACKIYEYFSHRINELDGHPRTVLSQARIVPFFQKSSQNEPEGSISNTVQMRYLAPPQCFIGSGGRYAAILDCVDFGALANNFLFICGAKTEPGTVELCQMVVREPNRVFTALESTKYQELLLSLAASWSELKKDKSLRRDMRASPFLLAYREFPSKAQTRKSGIPDEDPDVMGVRTFELTRADKIVLVDDVISYNIFKGSILVCPFDDVLEEFYSHLGSSALSALVVETPTIGQEVEPGDYREATKLQNLVRERIPLLLHDLPADRIIHSATWMDRNLSFVCVRSITLQKSLRGESVTETTGAFATPNRSGGMILYFAHGYRDYFHIARALLAIFVNRFSPQNAIVLTSLLDTDLSTLRSRGYNVERILRRKAADARMAEEQRQRMLEEEQRNIRQQEAERQASQVAATRESPAAQMPGHFPESHTQDAKVPYGHEHGDHRQRPTGGFFDSIARSFGPRRPPHMADGPPLPPPPYSVEDQTAKKPAALPPVAAPPVVHTSPAKLQQNLLNAIKSSRSYNSESLTSQPQINNVKETSSFCDARPAQNIKLVAETSSAVKIYLSPAQIPDMGRYVAANSAALDAFAGILLSIAEALALPPRSVHIFAEPGSSTIAFNSTRALFFNYQYFESLHLPDVQQGRAGDALIYWFVTLCHELAHNLVADHSSGHSYYTEMFVVRYFGKVAELVAKATTRAGGPGIGGRLVDL